MSPQGRSFGSRGQACEGRRWRYGRSVRRYCARPHSHSVTMMTALGSPQVTGHPPPAPVDPALGLNEGEVQSQLDAGHVNCAARTTGRTVPQILRANVLTRFNAILGSLFVIVLIVGPVQDALFGVVLVLNTSIGVLQEWRSKRVLDNLAILNAPTARAIRSGATVDLPFDQIVLGDVLEVQRGDQIPVDGQILSSDGLEVDESLLTGESAPIAKASGDPVLSGSAAVAGKGRLQTTVVGEQSYARGLEASARRFSLISSELQQGTNRILQWVTWVMVPTGLALVATQLLRSHQSSADAIRGSVAGIAAMVPEGLVLLTSMAFAVGALRLARNRVLVQELAAVEGLARVDVLCIDKTGTLTEPGLQLLSVELLSGIPKRTVEQILSEMVRADPAPNSTVRALSQVPQAEASPWAVDSRIAFSSSRKWSAVSFAEHGTWVLGAPEVLLTDTSESTIARARVHEEMARRVLVLTRSRRPVAENASHLDVEPVALVVLAERVRQDAAPTIRYLLEQGITIKVLSGDAPATVTQVAQRLGLPSPGPAQDVGRLGVDDLRLVMGETNLVGRVRPEQKSVVVQMLQHEGHVVAMIGDGVNDVQALKQADLGIAMGSGSQSSRSVARVVLLDNAFSAVPGIVAEGRRVISNIERVAKLFVTKTVYAALLAIAIVVWAVPYPFFPRHLTIVSTLTIGVPGFFLAFGTQTPRAVPGFARRVLRFTLPAGIVTAGATLAAYLVARSSPGATLTEMRTAALLCLFGVAWWVLILISRPVNVLRLVLILAMAGSFVALFTTSLSRSIFGLALPDGAVLAAVIVIAVAAMGVLTASICLIGRLYPPTSTPRIVEGHAEDQDVSR
jgi:cation-transporting ATPase E